MTTTGTTAGTASTGTAAERPAPPASAVPGEEGGWTRGPALADVRDGAVTVWRPEGTGEGHGVAIVRIGEQLAAYRDACAHAGLSLERGLLDPEGCVLTCPWHGMTYRALTGEALSPVRARLHAYPTRVHGGALWVRLAG